MVQNVCVSISHVSAGLCVQMNCSFDVYLPVNCRSTTTALLFRDFCISGRCWGIVGGEMKGSIRELSKGDTELLQLVFCRLWLSGDDDQRADLP